jgi:anti-sigma regulatory factor (Ser/Thr protein kinase)
MRPFHARFYEEDGRHMVEVTDDNAHMFINGRDVLRADLKHNDEIALGPLRLKVVDASRISSSVHRLDQLIDDLEKFESEEMGEVYDFAREDLFYLVTRDPSLRQAIAFHIPSKDKFIEQAQSFLARMAKNCDMDEPQVDAFMTVAKELILNAHRHGHAFNESKVITIAYRDLRDRLMLTITDQGNGFDHRSILAALKNKDAAQAVRERYQAGGYGGLGFRLVTRLAKNLTYNDVGNRVTFSIMKKADSA